MKYDMKLIAYINAFESLTRARVKDVFEEDGSVVYVIQEGEIGKALGKNASNLKRAEGMLKKKIRLIEFSSDPIKFLGSLLYPYKVEIKQEDDKLKIVVEDSKIKGKIFGRDRSNLKRINSILKKYYPLEAVIE